MKIKTLTINTRKEVFVKITKEILRLFKIEITGRHPGRDNEDYAQFSIVYQRISDVDGCVQMKTRLYAFSAEGNLSLFEALETGCRDERESAAQHRLAKLGLYHILCRHFYRIDAPWGILHGVRPTKIVHRWIAEGLSEEEIVARLGRDYACSSQKAMLITPMAFRQLPILKQTNARTISVYVGIPFCLSRCLYCSFPSNVLPGNEEIERFMEVWKRDLFAVVQAVRHYHFHVQNIYVGGGTPTALPDEVFTEMLSLVYNAFGGPDCLEFTVEAGRPDSMSEAKLQVMKKLGVTRISVNPQTMQEKTLRRIGRKHTPEQVIEMYRAVRRAGIPSVNMDLILGLPGETPADVEDTMKKIIALGPDDITLHALALKKGSRLKRLMEEEHVELPSDEQTRRMSEIALQYIEVAGMHPYYLYRQGYMSGDLENIGCCRPGAEGRYNIQIMEEHQTVLGIGGAAASKIVFFDEDSQKPLYMKSCFHAKDLAFYEKDIDKYIEKRAELLKEAYGD